MGHREEEQKKKDAEADGAWFAERMSALVEEIKTTKEATRAGYLRNCLKAAMAMHARCLNVTGARDLSDPGDFE